MSSLTGRPVTPPKTTEPSEPEPSVRFAFVWCPCSYPPLADVVAWPNKCQYCGGKGRLKLPMDRLAPGSKAKGGSNKAMGGRTTIDAKFSLAVRARDRFTCTRCGKNFEDNPGGLDCAHYISRGYKALRPGFTAHSPDFECCARHSMDNALSLCKSEHDFLHRINFLVAEGGGLTAFWDGSSPGTKSMIDKARKAGILFEVFEAGA